ncbi:hypothetical protein DMH04_28660 [Kibdelosporangium aridum]|uniref:Metallo-beta-lactamase domain-containing protein n=1 Tax=Kibdelosporangium aridum TaxID=2030 RepID=A0A428Z3W2_KIBAR|nr:MBL fold metallo-hydrolase [Kibdelosporangium aridum]RSM80888.1 hypothetical protein DMH04_28660 [Kibdelosporangium aridum]
MRFVLLGVGAMNSPRYRPAGLLLSWRGKRIMFDGGPGAQPRHQIDAWLVTDQQGELIREIRRLAEAYGTNPIVATYTHQTLRVQPRPVGHTSHPTYGYLLESDGDRVVWAPEFWEFPPWAAGADLMFADAAGWNRAIHFAGNVGGHACVATTARAARNHGVKRLVFAHIGRPAIRAIDQGAHPAFGEWGVEGRLYQLR